MTLKDLKSQLNALPLHDFTDTPIESVLAEAGALIVEAEDPRVAELEDEVATLTDEAKNNEAEIEKLNAQVWELKRQLIKAQDECAELRRRK